MTPTVHVMQGLPAAGKTTLATKLCASAARPLRRVSLDGLRLMLDGAARQAWWPPGSESATQRAEAALVAQLVADGCDVVVDDTHLHPAQVDPLRSALAGARVRWCVHRVATPPTVCLLRDIARVDPVGAACIRDLHARHRAATDAGWRLTPGWLRGAS